MTSSATNDKAQCKNINKIANTHYAGIVEAK